MYKWCIPFVDTVPRGDIIIEYENPLDIYCVLNDKKYIASKGGNASSAIYFIHNYNRLPDGMVIKYYTLLIGFYNV